MNWTLARSKIPLVMAYFVAASLALTLTRYEGGVAFLWAACGLLIADLMRSPRARWIYSIVPCMAASFIATGLFGMGLKIAPFFSVVNAAEAIAAAWMFRRYAKRHRMLGSVSSLWQFVLAAGIVAPLVAAALAGCIFWALGRPPARPMFDVFTGHALGNLTVTPLAIIFVRGHLWRRLTASGYRKVAETLALLLLMIGVSIFVFVQNGRPLLFLPVLPIIIIAFRAGAVATVIAIVLLALIGGIATTLGTGPVHLFAADFSAQMQFFQFYLAITVLTSLPVVADLQNRARLHALARTSEARFRLLAEHSTDILLHLEIDGRIRYVSPSIEALSGHKAVQLIGRNSVELVAPEDVERIAEAHRAVVAAGGATQSYEYLGLSADGSMRWFENQSRAICDDDGNAESVISIARDISARKMKELRLASEALTDPLTGLPNRRSFEGAIDRRMKERHKDNEDCIAVFDIDLFKGVNDRYGHDAGDAVLRTFAQVVRRVVRDTDSIARIGGEEFAVLFPATAVPQALMVCDRLRIEMAKALTTIGDDQIRVTVSGGVALLGEGGPDVALRQADQALYTAKRGGRDQMALAA